MKYLPLICLVFIIYGFKPRNRYQKLPGVFNNVDSLIKFVVPCKHYTYWAFCNYADFPDTGRVIFSRGAKPDSLKFKWTRMGLFSDCLPSICYKYIEYVDNGKVGYINTPAQFKAFLGPIDNLQEAVLLAKSEYYLDVDDKNKKGGSFFFENGIYKLRLVRYKFCPDAKESIEVTIDNKNGTADTLNRGAYRKSKRCTII